jgi:DNA-binding PadR family transcriptional regulator
MLPGVTTRIQVTTGVAQVLTVLLEDPRQGRYGLELMRATGQPSGTLYPILTRLVAAGWLRAEWEEVDAKVEGRPARRYYVFTPDGLALARTELAALHAKLRPRGGDAIGPAGLATGAP